MVTDADRLAAAGAPLTIAGHDFHLKYTPRSLKMIEDRYGSFGEFEKLLRAAGKGNGKLVGLTFAVLAMGLQHEKVDGVRVDEDWLLDNGDLKELNAYTDAYTAAMDEAFPAAVEGAPMDPTPPVKNGMNGSTSHPSSGSLSPDSTEAQASSGTK